MSSPARRGTLSRRPSPSSARTAGRWWAQARSKSASARRAARRPPSTSSDGRTEEGKRQKLRRRTATLSSTVEDERQHASHQSLTTKDRVLLIGKDEKHSVFSSSLLPFA